MREGALPSQVNQARFVRETVSTAASENIDVNVIEAFDQSWKRASEGTVGGHWGIFSTDRKPKFPLTGPVVEEAGWPWYALASMAIAFGGMLIAWRRKAGFGLGGWLLLAIAVEGGASALVWQARHAALASVSTLEWCVELGLLALAVCCGAAGLSAMARSRPDEQGPAILSAGQVLDEIRHYSIGEFGKLPCLLGLLRLLVAVAAAATVLCFIVDPRYRDFPTPAYVVPALAFAALAWRRRPHGPLAGEERLLAAIIAVGAVIVALKEGLENGQALGFAVVMLVVASSLRAGLFLRGRTA
jgi:glucan 1,3-beta-glucosidase